MKYCQTASAYNYTITPCDQKSRVMIEAQDFIHKLNSQDYAWHGSTCLYTKKNRHCKLALDVELHDATPTLVTFGKYFSNCRRGALLNKSVVTHFLKAVDQFNNATTQSIFYEHMSWHVNETGLSAYMYIFTWL